LTVIDEVASWTSGLEPGDIPGRVMEVARNQVLSVMGAVHAGAGCAGGRAVIDTVGGWDEPGRCSRFPGGAGTALQPALLQNCSLAMALDYDDYLFLGHTGHSAVCVPLAVGEMVGADTATVLAAQVAANEVAGRLGASVAIGPHNGQMWAHIHLLGAAAAASKVLGLDAERTANAMGIALAEPVYALFPGFMGPQSKLLIAATPAITGATAAFLARSGMTGARSILEDEQGFWSHFAFVPAPFMMTGLGRAWVTDTIAFKPYPGCAYIDTAMDALFEILDSFGHERGRALEPGEVRRVVVEASLLTVAMDAMSSRYMDPSRLSPTSINFSLSVSVAIGLLAGQLTGAQLTEEFLDGNRAEIVGLASRVELEHSAPMSVAFMRSMDEVVDLGAVLAGLELKTFLKARHRLREHLSGVATMGRREALSAWRSLEPEDRSFLRGLLSLRRRAGAATGYDLGARRLEDLMMPFAARVTVFLDDGAVLEAEKKIPRGAPGDPGRLDVPAEKFLREAAGLMGDDKSHRAVGTVREFESVTLEQLRQALSPDDDGRADTES
jgi:2-methylcitrate dehydratase PrpD